MISFRRAALTLVVASMGIIGIAATAQAQATRTWISGVGDDANPCSRTAPCKTWAGAISKTSAGGEIDALDPGGFGGLTITKSITLDGGGGQVASVLVAGTPGISINAGATDVVIIRNLRFQGLLGNGSNSGSAGTIGINLVAAGTLIIEKCAIVGFSQWGIKLAPNATAEALVADTSVFNNGTGGPGVGGILASVSGGAILKVELNNVQTAGNNGNGIKADGTNGSGGVINLAVRNSVSAGNTVNGIVGTSPSGGATVNMLVSRSEASHNPNAFGIIADGAGTTARIGDSMVFANATGVGTTNSGTLQSFKDNEIAGNSSDGTPIAAFPGPGGPLQ